MRPRVGATGVSGLGTLLSGAYIGVDAGRSEDTLTDFTGLESPPAVTGDQKGTQYVLRGDSLGSVDIGSPVYYRRVQVGQVVGFSLDKDGTGVTFNVFVNAPYNQYVGVNSRWWQASGVDLRLDSSGLKLNTQSLATVILGGIAFQTPPNQLRRDRAEQHDVPPRVRRGRRDARPGRPAAAGRDELQPVAARKRSARRSTSAASCSAK